MDHATISEISPEAEEMIQREDEPQLEDDGKQGSFQERFLSGPETIRKRAFTIKKNLKDMGAAFAVISVFIATLDVGLLSYTDDIFSRRRPGSPSPTSDKVITALFFISIMFAVSAVMKFSALQLFNAESAMERLQSPETAWLPVTHEKTHTSVGSKDGDIETAAVRREATNENLAERLLRALFYYVALIVATGILVFVWSNESRSVAISITVVFAIVCPSPFGSLFNAISLYHV